MTVKERKEKSEERDMRETNKIQDAMKKER